MGSFLEAPTLAERLSNMESLHLFIDRFFEDSQLFVQALEDNNEATAASATRNASLLALISGLVVLISLAVTVYLVGQVRQVQRTAQSLSQGQFEARTGLNSGDEIGQIGAALDSLAGQVQGLLAGSEEVVQARTRQLQTVLDVNARISNILQVDRLLQDVSDVVKERFGLYHAHVYLLNPGQDRLVLTAGSGYVGRQMVAEGRVIDMKNLNSIAATAARTRTPVYVEDVRQSPTFLAHPLLPNTRSELSLPLIARGSVIGVLDVQSELLAFFDEQTQTILATMATQIATAISNARQFEQAEQTSRHEQAMNTIGQQLQTARTVDEVLRVASRELGKALRVPQTSIELQVQPEGPNPFSGPLTVEDN
jgi:putative methionine-R-sulfoxide reductase with GAF domain